jgi:hypothetical protein
MLWQVLAVWMQVSAAAAACMTCSGSASAELIWLLRQANSFSAYDKPGTPAIRKGAASSKITAPACQADTHSSTQCLSAGQAQITAKNNNMKVII